MGVPDMKLGGQCALLKGCLDLFYCTVKNIKIY